jgi:hypothetical protein
VDFYIIPKMTDRPLLTCTDIWAKELISFHRKPNKKVRLFQNKLPGIMNLGKYKEPQLNKSNNNNEQYLPENTPKSLKDSIFEIQSLFTTSTACSIITLGEFKICLTTKMFSLGQVLPYFERKKAKSRGIIDDLSQRGIV